MQNVKKRVMQKIRPFLWFDGKAEEAAKFYASVFKNSEIRSVSPMSATFRLDGLEFIALNGGPQFKFTPAISFFVKCKTQPEIDDLWKKLSSGGTVLMELDKYPFSEKFGWVQDKFGVSWQLNLTGGARGITPFLMFAGKQHGRAKEAINFYVSLFVRTETQEEIDYFWKKLSAGGEKGRCGWLKDKFGVSWQIVPPVLGEFLNDEDEEKSERVMKAMLEMDKLDIKALKRAYQG